MYLFFCRMCDFDPGKHAVIYIQFCSLKLDVTGATPCAQCNESTKTFATTAPADGQRSHYKKRCFSPTGSQLDESHHPMLPHENTPFLGPTDLRKVPTGPNRISSRGDSRDTPRAYKNTATTTFSKTRPSMEPLKFPPWRHPQRCHLNPEGPGSVLQGSHSGQKSLPTRGHYMPHLRDKPVDSKLAQWDNTVWEEPSPVNPPCTTTQGPTWTASPW